MIKVSGCVLHSEISLLGKPLSFTGWYRKLKIIAAGLCASRCTLKKRGFSEMPLLNQFWYLKQPIRRQFVFLKI